MRSAKVDRPFARRASQDNEKAQKLEFPIISQQLWLLTQSVPTRPPSHIRGSSVSLLRRKIHQFSRKIRKMQGGVAWVQMFFTARHSCHGQEIYDEGMPGQLGSSPPLCTCVTPPNPKKYSASARVCTNSRTEKKEKSARPPQSPDRQKAVIPFPWLSCSPKVSARSSFGAPPASPRHPGRLSAQRHR